MGSGVKRVLIVEDSPVMRQLLVMVFKDKPDVVIDQAGDGIGAIQAVRTHGRPYDLVLLDLNMPVMDGMKFLKLLREIPEGKDTVVAIVTTEESEAAETKARALGATYYLRKPVTKREVDEVVREVLFSD